MMLQSSSERPQLSRADLEAFDSRPQGGSTEKRYRCPFCQAKERAFHVNLTTGTFNCKRASCRISGQLTDFWRVRPEGAKPFTRRDRARAGLARAFSLDSGSSGTLAQEVPRAASDANASPNTAPAAPVVTQGNWRELWNSATTIDDTTSQPGAQYLEGRGLAVDAAAAAGVRFSTNWAPSAEGKKYRAGAAVLYPSKGESGDVVAVSGRYLAPLFGNDGKPIKARTGGEAKQGVFLAPARIGEEWVWPFDRRLDAVVVVEGQADAMALAVCGFPTLAAGGVNLAPWLHRWAGLRRVLLAPDNDKGGDEAAPLWEAYLHSYGARCERLIPDGKDWNEMLLAWGRDELSDWLFSVYGFE